MVGKHNLLRYASPNEQRTISRESLGLYHAVIVGASYELGNNIDVESLNTFCYPLRCCIDEHPYLSVAIGDMDTDKSYYQRTPMINLENHVSILDRHTAGDDLRRIEEVLAANLDLPFPRDNPPWRVVILPLRTGCFIAFCYSHAIGDGLTGKAFHRTFLEAFKHDNNIRNPKVQTIDAPIRELPAPFDTAERLPVSWAFLLSPILSLILPSSLSTYLGLRTTASKIDSGTWNGSRIPSIDGINYSHSMIKLREIKASTLENALCIARKHDAKLTGVFEEIIVRAMSQVLLDHNTTNFVSQTAINMRKCIGVPDDEGGEFASSYYIVHPLRTPSESFLLEHWEAARLTSRKLAEGAATLQDQPIGLLRYLPSMRKWTMGRFGQNRDCSFEVSNIGAFSDRDQIKSSDLEVKVTRMIFAQPGQIISAPLAFNLVSVGGGSLSYTVSWQIGSFGNIGMEEDAFIDTICAFIDQDFETLS